MAVGGLLLVEDGDGMRHEQVLERVGARLHLVPRYRQRLQSGAGGLANPVWVDDRGFVELMQARTARGVSSRSPRRSSASARTAIRACDGASSAQLSRSTSIAWPIPPATHIDSMP